jgi:chemotaxis protein methyltransferase CheR
MEELEECEVEDLIGNIRENSGFDFSGYARPSLRRRMNGYLIRHQLTPFQFRKRIALGSQVIYDIIQELTVNYSEMFRDPDFFEKVRSEIVGYLASFPTPRIWVAGCAGGEEAYSFAILLREAQLLDRSLIYATDLSENVLEKAREGIFSLGNMRMYSENYLHSKGPYSLSDYYYVAYDRAVMMPQLGKNIIFSLHDLTGDGVFNEFQWVSCRNVMIYFTPEQRKKVLHLLYESLNMLGFLFLGKRESLRYSGLEQHFRVIDSRLNIYQKIS